MERYKDIVKKVRDIERRWTPGKPRLRVPRMTVLKQPAQLPPPPSGFWESTAPVTNPLYITCVVPTAPSLAVKEGLQLISRNRKQRCRDVIPSRDWMSEFPELLEAWVKVGLKIRPISIIPMVEDFVKETDWWWGAAAAQEEPPQRLSESKAWSLSLRGVLKEVDRSRGVLRDPDGLQLFDILAALVFGESNVATFQSQPRRKQSAKEYVMFKGDHNYNIFSIS